MSLGRLDHASGSHPISDINMTPLVDVMLVLVVILIMTVPLLTGAIALDLPRADTAKPHDAPRSVVVTITASGQIYIQDHAVSLAQLADRLSNFKRIHPETDMQLLADQAVPYGRVVEVMSAAQKAGLNRIGFVANLGKTRPSEQHPEGLPSEHP